MASKEESTNLKQNKTEVKETSKKVLEMLMQTGVPTDGTCLYCQTNNNDELKVGRLLHNTTSGITVHHYCLLFASGLSQRGREHQGIEGFLPEDIIREFRRAKRLVCRYCMNKGATIGCVIKRCQMTFHFHCGLANGTLSQFFGNFNSFCFEHRPSQECDTSCGSPSKSVCPICFCDVPSEMQVNVLKTPCCKNLWLHRDCLQRQAISSGYFFRCPICNNKKAFEKEMKKFGIYIPEQDASWEREDGAYQDLLERHHNCDADDCLCPKGRTFSKGKQWMIILCALCGSQGCHIKCGGLKNQLKDWACSVCNTEMDSKKIKSATLSKKQLNGPSYKMKLQGKTVRTPLPTNKLLKTFTEDNNIQPLRFSMDEGVEVARKAAGVSLPVVAVKPLSWQEITEHGCVEKLLSLNGLRKSSRTACRLEISPMIYQELDELLNSRKRALDDSDLDEPPVINRMPKRFCLEFPSVKENQQRKTPVKTKFIQTKLFNNDKDLSQDSALPNVVVCPSSADVVVGTPTSNEVIIISSDEDSPVVLNIKSLPKVSTCGRLCEQHQREADKKAYAYHLAHTDLTVDVILDRTQSERPEMACHERVPASSTKSETFFDDFNSAMLSDTEIDVVLLSKDDEACSLKLQKLSDELETPIRSYELDNGSGGQTLLSSQLSLLQDIDSVKIGRVGQPCKRKKKSKDSPSKSKKKKVPTATLR